MDITNRLYKTNERVYFNTTELKIHNQRGRHYIKHKGKQINVKNIPFLPKENDHVFEYIFCGKFIEYPCIAMDYWIRRWRLKNKITTEQFKLKFQ